MRTQAKYTPQSLSRTSPPPRSKPRRFPCNYEGCEKAFTRAEHLQRHELNHLPSPNTCKRCCAHFARPDLLDRHMERHAQKDRAAGGEGLGVLVTRKRCWRDHNGNITTKRPTASFPSLPKPSTSPESQKEKAREEGGGGSDGAGNMSGRGACATTTVSIPLPYPPASSARPQYNDGDRASSRSSLAATVTEVGACDQFQSQQLEFVGPGLFENENFQLPPPQTYQLDPLLSDVPSSVAEATIAHYQPEFDQTFSTDPASSFTMPFTTLGRCAWLSGGSDSPSGIGGQSATGFDLSQGQSGMGVNLEPPFAAGSGNNDQLMATPVDDSPFFSFDVKTSTNTPGTVSQQYHDFQGLRELNNHPLVEGHSLYFLSDAQSIPRDAPSGDSPTTTTANTTRHSLSSEPARTFSAPDTQHSIPVASSPALSHDHFHSYASTSASTSESPSPTLSSQPFPKINEIARTKVLSLIMQATTNANGEPQFSWNDQLLSLSALQNYLDHFFSRFNPLYPLLRRPLFNPSNVDTLLLVSVLMLGATYSGKDAHQMAVRVLVSVGFLMTPGVWRRKPGTNLYELEGERICSLIISMLRSNCGHCKQYC